MTRSERLKNLTDEELETEFLATRFRLLEIDTERSERITRRSERIAENTSDTGRKKEYLGVRDYKDTNQLAIGDKVYLRTKSGSKTRFAGIKEAIVIGLDKRGFVKIHEVGNSSNQTTRRPDNIIKQVGK